MAQEVVQALIRSIFRDKILIALILIGVLAIFMTGANKEDSPMGGEPNASNRISGEQPANPKVAALDPTLANDFIKWWLGLAMDYSPQTAAQSHQQAYAWMTKDAAIAFQSTYWTAETASKVAEGRIQVEFHLNSITAKAINPDGSIVVGVDGVCFMKSTGQSGSFPVKADFLVYKSLDGLRVSGIYNELANNPG